MTTDIEKQFFDTFGIEKRCEFDKYCDDCKTCGCYHYPRLTDRILLELILINMHNEDLFGYPTDMQELKYNTLKQLIETYNKFSICVTCDGEYQQTAKQIKQEIQALFKEI